jgi:hypothetical protein
MHSRFLVVVAGGDCRLAVDVKHTWRPTLLQTIATVRPQTKLRAKWNSKFSTHDSSIRFERGAEYCAVVHEKISGSGCSMGQLLRPWLQSATWPWISALGRIKLGLLHHTRKETACPSCYRRRLQPRLQTTARCIGIYNITYNPASPRSSSQ